MFRCHFCNQVTPPGTKKRNVVVETRNKTYPSRRAEIRRSRGRIGTQQEKSNDSGGKGVETKLEVAACPACAAKQDLVAPKSSDNAPE